jgi:hypothetical protein
LPGLKRPAHPCWSSAVTKCDGHRQIVRCGLGRFVLPPNLCRHCTRSAGLVTPVPLQSCWGCAVSFASEKLGGIPELSVRTSPPGNILTSGGGSSNSRLELRHAPARRGSRSGDSAQNPPPCRLPCQQTAVVVGSWCGLLGAVSGSSLAGAFVIQFRMLEVAWTSASLVLGNFAT